MIVQLTRNGPPFAGNVPAIMCYLCAEPITRANVPSGGRAPDSDGGNAYWRPSPDGRYIDGPIFLHKRCTRKFEEFNPGLWLWEELRVWLKQLLHNYSVGFSNETVHPAAEYIAPYPSEWRYGKYDRAKHEEYERERYGYYQPRDIDWDKFWDSDGAACPD